MRMTLINGHDNVELETGVVGQAILTWPHSPVTLFSLVPHYFLI